MMLMSPLSSSKKIDSTRLTAGIFLPVFFPDKTGTSSILISASAPAVLGSTGRISAAAKRAHAAGLHGVEVHAVHGYLPRQFLARGTNRRTDEIDARTSCWLA
jgi:hypothetical protein